MTPVAAWSTGCSRGTTTRRHGPHRLHALRQLVPVGMLQCCSQWRCPWSLYLLRRRPPTPSPTRVRHDRPRRGRLERQRGVQKSSHDP
jgi:hypothetical protein